MDRRLANDLNVHRLPRLPIQIAENFVKQTHRMIWPNAVVQRRRKEHNLMALQRCSSPMRHENLRVGVGFLFQRGRA
jgi:hypothetical protein